MNRMVTDGNMGNNNNQLGLARQICSQGLENFLVCNGGEWEKKLHDIREYLNLFDGLRDPIKAVTFLSYTEHGAFVVSLAPHTENPGNYKAAWIYVPNTVEISGDELERACNKTKNFLLSQCSIDVLKGDELFSKTYPEKAGIDYSPSTNENKFGIFYTGRYSLSEILSDYLYQENFSKYDAAFLLEKDKGISVKGNHSKVTDLSNDKLEKYYVLHCPDTRNFHGQPKIYIGGQPFDKDVRVKKGDTLSLTLKRSGFCDEQVKISVTDEKSIEPSEIEKLIKERTWKKKISKSDFLFIGEDEGEIKDKHGICVKVNGKEVGNSIEVEETDCENAEIGVYSEKYKLADSKKKYNLLRASITITLKRKIRTIKGKIKLANGKEADITLESKYLEEDYVNWEKSPLKGYSYGIQGSTLCPDEIGKWKSYAIGALAILAIEIIVPCCYRIGTSVIDYWGNHYIDWKLPPTIEVKKPVKKTTGVVEDVSQKPEEKDLTQVLNYLDGNDMWSKEELDKYPETEELFDALNRFNDVAVERIYGEELSEQSTKLKQIVDAFSNNRGKNFSSGKEENNGLYNKENDYKISVKNYIIWLSGCHAPTTSQQSMTKTGQASGNIGSSETKKSTDKTAKTSDPRNVADQ